MAASLKSWLFLIALSGIALGVSLNGSCAEEAGTATAGAREAKKAFSAVKAPIADMAPRAIGRYDRGCIAGAAKLPMNGPGWQVMRLSRNRYWGHPVLLAYIRKLASDSQRLDGSAGILVGDMAQPIGGPLLGGHASHQIGLDADLWYTPTPGHVLSAGEREQTAAANMVNPVTLTVDKTVWTETQVKLLHRAASYPEVARIFVHPAVKKALCEAAGQDRAWLEKIRPWYKHDDHFHIRLNCPPGSPSCVAQSPVPAGDDGCGKELDDWFKRLRAKPVKPLKPAPPPKPMLVSDLPVECQSLLAATEQAEKAWAASSSR
ncbi:MAG: penicillin-insensitive murein endopeptidase [Rhodomicrobium sp.]